MFKRLFLITFLIIALSSFGDVLAGYEACKQDGNIGDITDTLKGCLNGSPVLQSGDLTVSGGFKTLIINFVKNISIILSLFAIGFIAYGSLTLVSSGGNDEKIKKGKNIIKWSLIGFAGLVSASGIIALVVNFIYGFSGSSTGISGVGGSCIEQTITIAGKNYNVSFMENSESQDINSKTFSCDNGELKY